MISEIAIAAAAVVAGACVGSYASTVAVRLSRKEQATFGRSRCDGCGSPLGFAQTMPIVSYLSRGGVCSACGGRIDPLHPIGEVCGALVALAAYAVSPSPRAFLIAGLGLVLLASVLIDLRTRKLLDILTAPAALLCIALAYTGGGVPRLTTGAVAAIVTFLIMEMFRRGFLWLRSKPGLGFGDVKFLAALAIWLGIETPWALVIASAICALAIVIIRPADKRIPFGPPLAFGGFLVGVLEEAHLWPQP